jgi:hypothetical protein
LCYEVLAMSPADWKMPEKPPDAPDPDGNKYSASWGNCFTAKNAVDTGLSAYGA